MTSLYALSFVPGPVGLAANAGSALIAAGAENPVGVLSAVGGVAVGIKHLPLGAVERAVLDMSAKAGSAYDYADSMMGYGR